MATKYCYPNLVSEITSHGKYFSDFLKEASKEESNPAGRTWNNGTRKTVGVSETMANRMRPIIEKVANTWALKLDSEKQVVEQIAKKAS